MRETRIPGHCKCGRSVIKVLDSEVPTMWLDGKRFAYPERIDKDLWCIFRCEKCGEVIDENFVPDMEQA